jgi:endonuclease YncB( thermonuclease family)
MRRASVVPFRRPPPRRRPFRWLRPRGEVRAALTWAGLIAALALGYGFGAPAVDDWRSARRPMTPDCRVARVLDGDTLDLVCAGRGSFRARIVGYDAPELFSPRCMAERDAAVRATRVLGTWARLATTTEVAFLGHDRYGRTLVDMRLGGQRVARAMVATGNGRRYPGGRRGGWC